MYFLTGNSSRSKLIFPVLMQMGNQKLMRRCTRRSRVSCQPVGPNLESFIQESVVRNHPIKQSTNQVAVCKLRPRPGGGCQPKQTSRGRLRSPSGRLSDEHMREK